MTRAAGPSPRCRALSLELSRYLDGDLAPSRRRVIERHIAECGGCDEMAQRLRTTLAACRAEGRTRPPRAVVSRAAERIRALVARDDRSRSPSGRGRRRA